MIPAHDVDHQPVRVNDREQLIYLLTEAAEIEHGLMCSYLYAAWSLKQTAQEGLTGAQLDAVKRWRTSIHSVAMEEMLHLALVSNLLMSIGSPPHFSRPNFPIPPGYHPSSIVARLTPFTRQTADHFVYLERPEGMDLPQAKGFESMVQYERRERRIRVTPTAQDYDTISHLYRGIEEGFRHLAASLGEERLFLGNPACQLTADVLSFDGLIAVTDVDSAVAAISTIIEQGEGGRNDSEDSHFMKFCAVRDQYDSFLKEDPQFQPYRAVASDPVMFRPIPGQDGVHVSAHPASSVLDLANAAYGLMLRMLASGFAMVAGDDKATANAKATEITNAIAVMGVMRSLGVLLTTLPADDSGMTAGMNFHLPRSTLALPQRESGRALLAERANELAHALDLAANDIPALDKTLAEKLTRVAQQLANG